MTAIWKSTFFSANLRPLALAQHPTAHRAAAAAPKGAPFYSCHGSAEDLIQLDPVFLDFWGSYESTSWYPTNLNGNIW